MARETEFLTASPQSSCWIGRRDGDGEVGRLEVSAWAVKRGLVSLLIRKRWNGRETEHLRKQKPPLACKSVTYNSPWNRQAIFSLVLERVGKGYI